MDAKVVTIDQAVELLRQFKRTSDSRSILQSEMLVLTTLKYQVIILNIAIW